MSQSARFDPQRFKNHARAGFNRIASRYAVGAELRQELAQKLLDAARLQAGQTVLDLASGPAVLAALAHERVQPGGWVLATDIAEQMLIHAAATLSVPLRFAVMDAEQIALRAQSVDCVLGGLAVFMFPAPDKALAEMQRVLRPHGRVVFSVWGEAADNPLITCAQDCLTQQFGKPAVSALSVFRFGAAGELEALLAAAGFGQIEALDCAFSCRFDTATAYWQAFWDLAGGVAQSLAQRSPEALASLAQKIERALQAHRHPQGGYVLAARARIVAAQRL